VKVLTRAFLLTSTLASCIANSPNSVLQMVCSDVTAKEANIKFFKNTMSSSPWNKRFIIGTKKSLPAPTTQPNQMPSATTPISLKLNGNELVFENSTWRSGKLE
jgi:hypothetical protein